MRALCWLISLVASGVIVIEDTGFPADGNLNKKAFCARFDSELGGVDFLKTFPSQTNADIRATRWLAKAKAGNVEQTMAILFNKKVTADNIMVVHYGCNLTAEGLFFGKSIEGISISGFQNCGEIYILSPFKGVIKYKTSLQFNFNWKDASLFSKSEDKLEEMIDRPVQILKSWGHSKKCSTVTKTINKKLRYLKFGRYEFAQLNLMDYPDWDASNIDKLPVGLQQNKNLETMGYQIKMVEYINKAVDKAMGSHYDEGDHEGLPCMDLVSCLTTGGDCGKLLETCAYMKEMESGLQSWIKHFNSHYDLDMSMEDLKELIVASQKQDHQSAMEFIFNGLWKVLEDNGFQHINGTALWMDSASSLHHIVEHAGKGEKEDDIADFITLIVEDPETAMEIISNLDEGELAEIIVKILEMLHLDEDAINNIMKELNPEKLKWMVSVLAGSGKLDWERLATFITALVENPESAMEMLAQMDVDALSNIMRELLQFIDLDKDLINDIIEMISPDHIEWFINLLTGKSEMNWGVISHVLDVVSDLLKNFDVDISVYVDKIKETAEIVIPIIYDPNAVADTTTILNALNRFLEVLEVDKDIHEAIMGADPIINLETELLGPIYYIVGAPESEIPENQKLQSIVAMVFGHIKKIAEFVEGIGQDVGIIIEIITMLGEESNKMVWILLNLDGDDLIVGIVETLLSTITKVLDISVADFDVRIVGYGLISIREMLLAGFQNEEFTMFVEPRLLDALNILMDGKDPIAGILSLVIDQINTIGDICRGTTHLKAKEVTEAEANAEDDCLIIDFDQIFAMASTGETPAIKTWLSLLYTGLMGDLTWANNVIYCEPVEWLNGKDVPEGCNL